jgi:hypothetical protein
MASRNAARLLLLATRTAQCSSLATQRAACSVGVCGVPARSFSVRLFDRLIPEDDEKTKEFKERERRVVKERMARSKFGEASAAKREKVGVRERAAAG